MIRNGQYETEYLTGKQYMSSRNLPNPVPVRPLLAEPSPKYFLVKISPNPNTSTTILQNNTIQPSDRNESVKRHGFGKPSSPINQSLVIESHNNFNDFVPQGGILKGSAGPASGRFEKMQGSPGFGFGNNVCAGGQMKNNWPGEPGIIEKINTDGNKATYGQGIIERINTDGNNAPYLRGEQGINERINTDGNKASYGGLRSGFRGNFTAPNVGRDREDYKPILGELGNGQYEMEVSLGQNQNRGNEKVKRSGFVSGSNAEIKGNNFENRLNVPSGNIGEYNSVSIGGENRTGGWNYNNNYMQGNLDNRQKGPTGEFKATLPEMRFGSEQPYRMDLNLDNRQKFQSGGFGGDFKTDYNYKPPTIGNEYNRPGEYRAEGASYKLDFGLDGGHKKGSEKVKRSGIPTGNFEVGSLNVQLGGNVTNSGNAGILELEIKKLREENRALEAENRKNQHLIAENKRLTDGIEQYRHSISNFTTLDATNQRLTEENQALRTRLTELEEHFSGFGDIESRLEEKYQDKLRLEQKSKEYLMQDLQKLHDIEARIQLLKHEKVGLEDEIERTRAVKLTLDAQLNNLRGSYEDIEKEIRINLEREYEERFQNNRREIDEMKKEMSIQESKFRLNFDRELMELNAINRDLKEQLNGHQERVKKSSLSADKNKGELMQQMSFLEEELHNERILRIESERNMKQMKGSLEEMKQELENRRKEERKSVQMVPDKEKLMEEVVLELEKVNHALRIVKTERDDLRRRLGFVRLN